MNHMMRTMATLLCTVVITAAAAPAMAGGCKGCDKVAKKGEGFCCGKGIAYGVELSSEKLQAALSGKHVNATNCAGCKAAAKGNGRCAHCNVGVANSKVYRSSVSYRLAKGTRVTAKAAASCSGCKTAHKSNGRCTDCKVGFVGGRKFTDLDDYQAALTAHKTLRVAAKQAEKCEACAVAMVTDGKCESCKIKFKDGKKSNG
jgi:hypothetical protein